MSYDTYLAAFRKFLSEGMTYSEALDEFDTQALMRSCFAEMDRDRSILNDQESLFGLMIKGFRQMSDDADMEQAYELWGAGWTSEVPESYKSNSRDFWRQCPTMSLYWRAPSKRPGRPGRRYLSTNQAWRALQKQIPQNG